MVNPFKIPNSEALVEAAISPEKVLLEDEVVIKAGNPRNEIRFNPREK